jgi:signal transduction histidine kinase
VPERRAARTLETMDRQLTHMVRLIDDLLDISRINSGKIRLELARTSLRAALQTALELARPAMDAAGHALHVELPEPTSRCRATRRGSRRPSATS